LISEIKFLSFKLQNLRVRLKLSNDDYFLSNAILNNRYVLRIDDNDDEDKLKYYKQALARKYKYGNVNRSITNSEIVELLKYQNNGKSI
jgi:hypothetical protein